LRSPRNPGIAFPRNHSQESIGLEQLFEQTAMHVNIRKSSIKREKRGFRYRMKTRGGRQVIKRRRRIGRKLPGHKKMR